MHESHVLYARTLQAFESIPDYDAQRVGFFVLTLDRDGYYSGKPWANQREAYGSISRNARRFLKCINRRAEHDGVEPVRSRWVSTVEAHKTGWPHYQLLLYLPTEWAKELREHDDERRRRGLDRHEEIGRKGLYGWLSGVAESCGWGRRSSFEAARDGNAAAGYLVKTAGSHEAAAGEVAKLCQLPLNAPERFRRFRSGKGFLPPRHKNPDVTGVLIRSERSREGDWEIRGMNATKDAAEQEQVQLAIRIERELVLEEEAILSRGGALHMPPIRLVEGGQIESLAHATEARWAASVEALARA